MPVRAGFSPPDGRGFLLLHVYNEPMLPGVKRVPARYEAESGRLRAVSFFNVKGTLVIPV